MLTTSDQEAYAAYVTAGLALATSVEIRDRLDTDPTYPADRSLKADAARDQIRADDLARFRTAKAAFLDAVSTN